MSRTHQMTFCHISDPTLALGHALIFDDLLSGEKLELFFSKVFKYNNNNNNNCAVCFIISSRYLLTQKNKHLDSFRPLKISYRPIRPKLGHFEKFDFGSD